MPPSVQAVDGFLKGLEAMDPEAAARFAHPDDQELVREGVKARSVDPTSQAALALPPTPLDHYIVEIESKSDDGRRHVVRVDLTLKNPLPAMSKRVGQELDGIPETRTLKTRFLSERVAGDRWRVKLDLPATRQRADFVRRFEKELSAGRLEAAEALLSQVPAPPDNAEALQKTDRLLQTLQGELDKVRKRVGTHTTGSTTAKDLRSPRPSE